MPQNNPYAPDEVKVDIEKEIRKLAQADKVDLRRLVEPVDLTRHDYYRATVIAYYRGRDDGYMDAFVHVARFQRRARILAVLGVMALIAGVLFWLGVFPR